VPPEQGRENLNNPCWDVTLLRFAVTVAENLNDPSLGRTLLRFALTVVENLNNPSGLDDARRGVARLQPQP
jgi:hypothetical protein